jgi:hypothetical protein
MSQSTIERPVESKGGEEPRRNAEGPQRERLVEHVADWRTAEVTVDTGKGVIANVALSGLVSKNGYRYAEAALRDAAPLYAGKPVFLDHAPDPGRPQERSTRDLAGAIARPRFHEGRLRADIATNATDAGRTLLALAERDQPGVGMSHVVLAERNNDGTVVEKIHEVVSVDAVVFPATTRTFREHATAKAQANDDGDRAQQSHESHNAAAPAVHREEKRSPVERRLDELDEAVQELRAALARHSNGVRVQPSDRVGASPNGRPDSQHSAAPVKESDAIESSTFTTPERPLPVERLVAEAALPGTVVTPEFVAALEQCGNAETVHALLAERAAFVRRIGTRLPTSHERHGAPDAQADDRWADAALVAAVRNSSPGVLGM